MSETDRSQSPARVLLQHAIPMFFALLTLGLVGVVDAFFLGRLGPDALAAFGYSTPAVSVLIGVSIGLGIGATFQVAVNLGANNARAVRTAVLASIAVCLAFAAVIHVGGTLLSGPFFDLLKVPARLRPMALDYLRTILAGSWFLVAEMMGMALLRGTGDMMSSAVILSAAGLVNVALDPILIFGHLGAPRLGMKGAAIATVCSYVVASVLVVVRIARNDALRPAVPESAAALWASVRAVVAVGLPASVSQLVGPVTAVMLSACVGQFGTSTLGAFAVGTRVEQVGLLGAMALGAGLAPLVGQAWGAGERAKARTYVGAGGQLALLWGIGCATMLTIVAAPLSSMFVADAALGSDMRLFFRVGSWAIPTTCVAMVCASALNAGGFAKQALLVNAARCAILVAAVLAVPVSTGALGVFVAYAVSPLAGALIAWYSTNVRVGLSEKTAEATA